MAAMVCIRACWGVTFSAVPPDMSDPTPPTPAPPTLAKEEEELGNRGLIVLSGRILFFSVPVTRQTHTYIHTIKRYIDRDIYTDN